MRRDPGRLKIAMSLANALDVDVDPEVVHGLFSAASLLRDLGHEVVEASPALPPPELLDVFLQVFGPGIALGIGLGERLAGRDPDEDEIEPLSRAVLEHARSLSSTGYLTSMAQLQLLARGTVRIFADYDLLMTPVLAARPLPIGELHGCGDDPWDDLMRSGRFAAVHRDVQPDRAAGDLAAGGLVGDDDLPTAVQIVGPPLGEGRCCRSRRRSRPHARGRTGGRCSTSRRTDSARTPRTSPSARGATPSAFASAVPRRSSSPPAREPTRPT